MRTIKRRAKAKQYVLIYKICASLSVLWLRYWNFLPNKRHFGNFLMERLRYLLFRVVIVLSIVWPIRVHSIVIKVLSQRLFLFHWLKNQNNIGDAIELTALSITPPALVPQLISSS